MHVWIEDGFSISKGAGIGQYSLNLYSHLKNLPGIKDVELIHKPFLEKIRLPRIRRLLFMAWLETRLQALLLHNMVDVLHFTNYLIPSVRLTDTKYVTTIHDLAAWKVPETLPAAYVPYIKWAVTKATERADIVFVVSNTVKDELIRLFHLDERKIYVGYNGLSDDFVHYPKVSKSMANLIKEKYVIKKRFILFVGTIEKRKNIITLIRAFNLIKNKLDIQLVLAGSQGFGFNEIKECLRESEHKNDIIMTGHMPESEKIALYDMASLFVFPSLYEGFGIPLIEAMSRKLPIIASDIPSTKEIASNAAIYYGRDPYDFNELATVIITALDQASICNQLIQEGISRVVKFSWKSICSLYFDTYQGLLRKKI
jgi:glycosyltransferase involved in cell wall biosynthesis